MKRMRYKRSTCIVIIMIFLALFFRVSYRFCIERSDRDEITYLHRIDSFLNEDITTKENNYFLIICIGAFFKKHGFDPNIALRIVNLFFSVLWVYVMYLISKIVFTHQIQRYAVLLFCSINPYCVRISMMILRDPLYLFLFTSAIYLCLLFLHSRIKYSFSFVMPVIVVMSFWARYEGLELIVLYCLTFAFALIARFSKKMKLSFASCAIHSIIFATTLFVNVFTLYHFFPKYFKGFFSFLMSHDIDPVFNTLT